MGSDEDSEPRCSDSGDLSRAIAYGVLAALDRSPESVHLQVLVLFFTHLVYLFVFLGALPHKGRAPAVSPSRAQTITDCQDSY